MKITALRPLICALAVLMAMSSAIFAVLPVAAAEDDVYLGDRQDLFIARDSLDEFGWNTAHSGEAITVGTQTYSKGLGMHCLPDYNAYVEFDISSLGMKYFAASVGVLQNAEYYVELGSMSFHVYGDGVLLASSPVMAWSEEPYVLSCSVEGVKTLRLEQNNEDGHACDAGVWGDARLTNEKPEPPTTGDEEINPDKTNLPQPSELVSGDYAYLSDLYWMNHKTYPGNVVGRDCNTANEIIFSTDGKFFDKGLGFHATSNDYTSFVDVNIEGLGYTKFAAYYGICETQTTYDISMASVMFAVFGDGELLWESDDTMKFGQDMASMDCDISGVSVLRLAIAGVPDIGGSWGTWGGAVISKSGNITDDMIFTDLSGEIDPPTDPETDAPTDPETDVPTDPETDAPTDPETDAPTDPETDAPTDPETDAPTEPETDTSIEIPSDAITTPDETTDQAKTSKGGCGSVAGAGVVLMAGIAAAALKKKKEEGSC